MTGDRLRRVKMVLDCTSYSSVLQLRRFSSIRRNPQDQSATSFNDERGTHLSSPDHESAKAMRTATILNVADYLPLHNFSGSVYGVPMLLLFRLFYQAASFSPQNAAMRLGYSHERSAFSEFKQFEAECDQYEPHYNTKRLFDTYSRIEVSEFVKILAGNPDLGSRQVITSITWVKALASPLSHEYLQFLVSDRKDGKIRRLVVERSDVGDVVTIGWDWSSGRYASHHHVLPLPLVTLSFDKVCGDVPLSLHTFAEILFQMSRTRPYRLLREMCWWYAEKVLIETARQLPGVTIKEWPFANLRYSFVVRTEWIKRPALVKAAEEFRKMNIEDLKY